MALDPELLLLRDDGEEEFGERSGRGHAGGCGRAVAFSRWDGGRCARVVAAPSSCQAFCSRSQAGGFRGPVCCLQPIGDGVLFPSGHGKTTVLPLRPQ